MSSNRGPVAAFLIGGTILFGAGLFLMGDQHKAFSRHLDYYTDLANVDGLIAGSHVRVNGFDAGQITKVEIPNDPSGKFRLRLHVDDKLSNLIRSDSLLTVETDGLVGDKFVLIHSGSDSGELLANGGTIRSKEPIELSAILQKVSGTVDQANTTIVDVRGRLDGTLDSITKTVNNANGIVDDVRSGRGPVGTLLYNKQMTGDIKTAVSNTRDVTANLKQVSVQAGQVMSDFQSRGLVDKVDVSMDHMRHASEQIDQASAQVNTNLSQALAPDVNGRTAGENLQQTLSSVNTATSNMADDTEALKHEFFFRGYFKKRGFYSLQDLNPDEYRSSSFFKAQTQSRDWLASDEAFTTDANGHQILSERGVRTINDFAAKHLNDLPTEPIVIEGFSNNAAMDEQRRLSRERALLVKRYLEGHLQLDPKIIGVMPLEATPPASAGKSTFDGACIVLLRKAK